MQRHSQLVAYLIDTRVLTSRKQETGNRTGGDQPTRLWLTCVRGVTVSVLESGLRSSGMAGSS